MMPDDDYPHPLGLRVTENREREARASFAAPPLLACPFCGGKAYARQPYAPKDIWKIGCDALGCDVNPEVSGIYVRCVKAWNRRQANDKLTDGH